MYYAKCKTRKGYEYVLVYTAKEYINNDMFELCTDPYIKKYYRIPATFDIETSTIKTDNNKSGYESFMYIWQMCIQGTCIIGRTWNDWLMLLTYLRHKADLNPDQKMVIYVHNLSYEYEAIRKFLDLEVFATAPHKVLTCKNDWFEFRCSYYLSNMSLAKFIENTPTANHVKAVSDLDYRIVRTPYTVLDETELGYCINDVLGLYESIMFLLETDTLKSIPLTSTGYVRRDCRLAMRKDKFNRRQFLKIRLSEKLFILMQETFRGGNTATNRYFVDMILDDVGSWDISSSYPYVMLLPEFPIGAFMKYHVESLEELEDLQKDYCTISRFVFTNLKVKEKTYIPYLPVSKCNHFNKNPEKIFQYNGRILNAQLVDVTLTNIDLKIITDQYYYDEIFIKDNYFARKGYLPIELREQILKYFSAKSELKGIKGKEYEYMKSKNRLNGIYGMSVTNPVHANYQQDVDGLWKNIEEKDTAEQLDDFYKNWFSFLSYQWGVWVTALARNRLQQAIDLIGIDVVYCDTDSVKFIGDHDDVFTSLNDDTITYCTSRDIKHYVDVNGKRYYLGIWDKEPTYKRFKTLGAKKYAYEYENGKVGITVAGLSKKDGADELNKGHGLNDFYIGKIFKHSGRTTAYFNNQNIHKITVGNCDIINGSNISIIDTSYTLGISDTILAFLESLEE